MFVVLWEFTVAPAHRAAFERAYGPDGDWAALFRRCAGYVRTELLRHSDDAGVYVTVDRWASRDAFEAGIASLDGAYAELDRRCADLTTAERRLGSYAAV